MDKVYYAMANLILFKDKIKVKGLLRAVEYINQELKGGVK